MGTLNPKKGRRIPPGYQETEPCHSETAEMICQHIDGLQPRCFKAIVAKADMRGPQARESPYRKQEGQDCASV